MFETFVTKSWNLDKSIWLKWTNKILTNTSQLMTEEKIRISRVRLSKTLLTLKSKIQLLKTERATSTPLKEASIQTNSKTQTISCQSMIFWTSKTPVKLESLVQAQVLRVEICFRVLIHLTRTIQLCKCSCQIMKQIFLLFWANDFKVLILKWRILQNMFMNFRCKLIKDWVTWLKTWHCYTRIWTKLTIKTQLMLVTLTTEWEPIYLLKIQLRENKRKRSPQEAKLSHKVKVLNCLETPVWKKIN